MSSSEARWAARDIQRDPPRDKPRDSARGTHLREPARVPAPAPAGRANAVPWPGRQFSAAPPSPSVDFEDLTGFISAAASFRRARGTLPGTLDFTPPHLQGAQADMAGARAALAAAPASTPAPAPVPARDPVAEARAAWRQELLQELETELAERQAQADADLQAQLHEARQTGYQDGYRDGLVALDNFKQSFAQQVTSQVGQLVINLDQELQGLEQLLADSVTRTATELARQVVRSELALRPALVQQVAAEAMGALLKTARQVSISLHPDDQALVAQGCAEQLQRVGARLVADPTLARGGCVVDSDIGGIDARIATRWQLAARALGSPLAWEDTGDAPGADA